ncbi:hypothetical protein MNEG_16226, partial [Monoraphidium neglectum]
RAPKAPAWGHRGSGGGPRRGGRARGLRQAAAILDSKSLFLAAPAPACRGPVKKGPSIPHNHQENIPPR